MAGSDASLSLALSPLLPPLRFAARAPLPTQYLQRFLALGDRYRIDMGNTSSTHVQFSRAKPA